MDSNSPLKPLQEATPTVPGVPQVPDIPQVPDVPEVPKTTEPPKITGISMPAGANKKPESPAQRSEKINAANAPKPQKAEQKQNLLHRPVTMEEVETYRRNSAKKKRKLTFSIIALIILIGVAATAIILVTNHNRYQKLSTIYNDSLPIVIKRQNSENPILLTQNGKQLTSSYSYISSFESDRSLAQTTQDGATTNYIISNTGKEIYSTKDILRKINGGQNYIESNDFGSHLLDKNGKKLDERKIISTNFNDDQKYFLVADDNSYAVINANGQAKITGVLDKSKISSFSYAKNKYEDNCYCAIIITRKKDSKLYVYNCETAKEITNIENVYYVGGFEKNDSSFLISERGSSYFYNDEMIYNSETRDTEYVGGIIKRSSDEKFFNPVTRKTGESFPTDSLINQDKLNEKTEITENCTTYENHPESKLINICSNIYYNNKLVVRGNNRFEYYLADEKLDNFLSYNKKQYFYRKNNSNQSEAVMNADGGEEYNSLINTNVAENEQNYASRFVVRNDNQKKTVIDLATKASAEYGSSYNISLGTNYYIVSGENGIHYYNAKHKEIYKEEN